MRKSKILFTILISFIFIANIQALDYSTIEFSDDISISDNNNITIKLPISYKENNSKIEYQLIETTKEKIEEYENKAKELLEDLITTHNECADENNNLVNSTECLDFLDQANTTLYTYLPDIDDNNWIIKDLDSFDDDNVLYQINNTLDQYNWIAVKAQDSDGNTIYQISTVTPKYNNEETESIVNTVETNNNESNNDVVDVPDTKIDSQLIKLIGSCFAAAALALSYIYFRNKNKN